MSNAAGRWSKKRAELTIELSDLDVIGDLMRAIAGEWRTQKPEVKAE